MNYYIDSPFVSLSNRCLITDTQRILDRVEITSAGGLPQELSQEEFLEGVTAPRNKELIRVFKDVDLIENIGS